MMKSTIDMIHRGRRSRFLKWKTMTLLLLGVTFLLAIMSIVVGRTIYPINDVLRVLAGEDVAGATFAIRTLRLPRMLLGLAAGMALGAAGSIFQILLKNPLASPDIIGVTSGASLAALFCILILGWSGAAVSFVAVPAGIITAMLVYFISHRGVFSGAKLILIGIGIQAMLRSVISYLLLKASQNDIPAAFRWLSGSLNAAQMKDFWTVFIALIILLPIIIILQNKLQILELGDQSAISLGVSVERVRLLLLLVAVSLASFASASTGPIAFVAFLAGPIAFRITGGSIPHILPSALVGAILVLGSDLIGQFAFNTNFPVGVITGIFGAPYLLFLLVRTNRVGGSS